MIGLTLTALALAGQLVGARTFDAGSELETGGRDLSNYCANLYDQCGGHGWHGATCCNGHGNICVYKDDYYSQCRPYHDKDYFKKDHKKKDDKKDYKKDDKKHCAALYDQCGGKGFYGPDCCDGHGNICVFKDHYYSQCRPEHDRYYFNKKDDKKGGKGHGGGHHCAYLWEQCGGKNWYGPHCCHGHDNTCVFKDHYYSQCRPKHEKKHHY